MSDERIVEVMAQGVYDPDRSMGYGWKVSNARRILAALRDAGFDVYRPDDCELGQIDGATFANNPEGMDGLIVLVPSREHYATRQKVRLVPVGGDS